MAQRRAFVIRVWFTESDELVGQLSDLLNGWRAPFRSPAELWDLLRQQTPAVAAAAADPAEAVASLTNEGEA